MLKSYFELLKRIEGEIQKNPFLGSPQNLYDPLNYMIGLGGKRIRPVLTLMGCELYSGIIEKAIPSALAVEIFHNFSLIHDDIMDKAPVRRGKLTVHEKWDTNIAILSGDLMLVKAYECLLKSEEKYLPELFSVFNKMAAAVCDGQQMDMNFETQTDVTETDYLEMIRLKTSVLLGCSLQLGAIVADAPKDEALKLYKLGVNIGIGFQLMDDYLDAFGTPELVGKQPGGDILSNKKTIMLIKAMQTEKDKIEVLSNDKNISDTHKIEEFKSLFIKIGSDVYLKSLSENYFGLASQNLKDLKVKESKKHDLKELLVYLHNRSF
ncbi:MAG: polyprenyl synthetase family protein [Bacteroidia bacterium]